LTPLDPQRERSNEEDRGQVRPASPEKKWSPTSRALDQLLAIFSSDREEAGKQYEITRLKLLRFFEHRPVHAPERLVDETLDRVMRRIDEGETITNIMGYVFKVASYVFLEAIREQEQMRVAASALPTVTSTHHWDEEEESPRLLCFDRCLDGLPVETRELILAYYSEEGQTKIRLRRHIAEELGIRLNALRIRAHKIRIKLEDCVRECLAQNAYSK
jgi:DNA-directed RNA polymerase specialized sigma24 family protein